MSLLVEISRSMLFEALQVILGCLVAYGLYKALAGKSDLTEGINKETVLAAILSSLAGIVLPLDIFGVAPIILAASLVGIRFSLTIPMLASGFVFNMLVPFTQVGFQWQTNWLRIGTAFITGFFAGILAHAFSLDKAKIFREDPINQKEGPKSLPAFINRYISKAGLFLIVGVAFEVIFKEYFFYDFVNVFNISAIAGEVFGFIQGYNVSSRVFLLNMIMFNLVMNIKTLSGVVMMFRLKSAIGYYAYFVGWVLLICIINIFVS